MSKRLLSLLLTLVMVLSLCVPALAADEFVAEAVPEVEEQAPVAPEAPVVEEPVEDELVVEEAPEVAAVLADEPEPATNLALEESLDLLQAAFDEATKKYPGVLAGDYHGSGVAGGQYVDTSLNYTFMLEDTPLHCCGDFLRAYEKAKYILGLNYDEMTDPQILIIEKNVKNAINDLNYESGKLKTTISWSECGGSHDCTYNFPEGYRQYVDAGIGALTQEWLGRVQYLGVQTIPSYVDSTREFWRYVENGALKGYFQPEFIEGLKEALLAIADFQDDWTEKTAIPHRAVAEIVPVIESYKAGSSLFEDAIRPNNAQVQKLRDIIDTIISEWHSNEYHTCHNLDVYDLFVKRWNADGGDKYSWWFGRGGKAWEPYYDNQVQEWVKLKSVLDAIDEATDDLNGLLSHINERSVQLESVRIVPTNGNKMLALDIGFSDRIDDDHYYKVDVFYNGSKIWSSEPNVDTPSNPENGINVVSGIQLALYKNATSEPYIDPGLAGLVDINKSDTLESVKDKAGKFEVVLSYALGDYMKPERYGDWKKVNSLSVEWRTFKDAYELSAASYNDEHITATLNKDAAGKVEIVISNQRNRKATAGFYGRFASLDVNEFDLNDQIAGVYTVVAAPSEGTTPDEDFAYVERLSKTVTVPSITESSEYTVFLSLKDSLQGYEEMSAKVGKNETARAKAKAALDSAATVTEDWANTRDRRAQLQNIIDVMQSAANNLTSAISLETLQALVDQAKNLNEQDYTIVSWEAWLHNKDAAISAAEKVIAGGPYGDSPENREKISSAIAALKTAMSVLRYANADKAELQASIEAAQVELDKVDVYTNASWKALQDAVNAGLETLNKKGATQTEIDAAKKAVDDAVASLVLAADKGALAAKIKEAQALDPNKYTEESWASAKLADLIAAAQAVYDQADPTKADADAAIRAIDDAINSLVAYDPIKPPAGGTGWRYVQETGDYYFFKNNQIVKNYWVGQSDGASQWHNLWYYCGADGKMLKGFQYLTNLKGGYNWYFLQTTADNGTIGMMLTGWQATGTTAGTGWFAKDYGSQGACTYTSAWGDFNAAAGVWGDGQAHAGTL